MFSFLAIARQYSFSSPKINHCGKWKKKKKEPVWKSLGDCSLPDPRGTNMTS